MNRGLILALIGEQVRSIPAPRHGETFLIRGWIDGGAGRRSGPPRLYLRHLVLIIPLRIGARRSLDPGDPLEPSSRISARPASSRESVSLGSSHHGD